MLILSVFLGIAVGRASALRSPTSSEQLSQREWTAKRNEEALPREQGLHRGGVPEIEEYLILNGSRRPVSIVDYVIVNGSRRPVSIEDYLIVNGSRRPVSDTQYIMAHNANVNVTGDFSVVLQLPFNLDLKDRCHLDRIAHAKQSLPTNFNIVCFWWTNNGSNVDSNSADVEHLQKTCGGNLVIYHRDVLPHFADIAKRITPWWNAEVPFVLAVHQYKDTYFSKSDGIWYLEWDVHWQGSLGLMLQALTPDHKQYGYGTFAHVLMDCVGPRFRWHECKRRSNAPFIDYRNISVGLIQMVWYNSRLLDNMFEQVVQNHIPYCEAFAASLCEHHEDCKIYDFRIQDSYLFDYWHWKPFEGELKQLKDIPNGQPGLFYHPIKQCPVAAYQT